MFRKEKKIIHTQERHTYNNLLTAGCSACSAGPDEPPPPITAPTALLQARAQATTPEFQQFRQAGDEKKNRAGKV